MKLRQYSSGLRRVVCTSSLSYACVNTFLQFFSFFVLAINLCITQQDCANNGDQEYCDYANIVTDVGGDDVPQLVCATAQPYMNASSAAAAIYYGNDRRLRGN